MSTLPIVDDVNKNKYKCNCCNNLRGRLSELEKENTDFKEGLKRLRDRNEKLREELKRK